MTQAVLFLAILLLAVSCKKTGSPDINLEQSGHPLASKILAPGMGTVGLIQDRKVFVYFLNENYRWVLDKLSQFTIPEKNQGLIAMGIGTIGVIEDKQIKFYSLDAYNNWVSEERFTFELPKSYDRLVSVKMPWEIGILALEDNGFLEFYYLNQEGHWFHDETAVFEIPQGINNYFSLGNMTIAVVDDHRLGLYYLHPEGGWEFMDDYVLRLPEGYDAIIPWEPGIMAVLIGKVLEFYELDLIEERWIMDEDMRFELPI